MSDRLHMQGLSGGTLNRAFPPGPTGYQPYLNLRWDSAGKLVSLEQVPLEFGTAGAMCREATARKSSKAAIRAAGGGTLALAIAMMECRHLDGNPHDLDSWAPCYMFGDREADLSDPVGPDPSDVPSKFPGHKIIGFRSSERGVFRPKTGYAANFGLFKMCWYMISQTPAAKKEIGRRNPEDESVWREVGTKINGSPMLATQILIEATRGYQAGSAPPWDISKPAATGSVDNFWAGQRWGGSGLHNHDYSKEPDRTKPAPLPLSSWKDIQQYYLKVKYIQWMCVQDPDVWTSKVRYGSPLKNI